MKGQFKGVHLSEEEITAAECILADSLLRNGWTWSVRTDSAYLAKAYPDDQGEEHYWHFRQYSGCSDNKGARLVWINAFCDPGDHGWRHQRVFVLDGGDCYWQAVIDLATHKVLVFEVNGDA